MTDSRGSGFRGRGRGGDGGSGNRSDRGRGRGRNRREFSDSPPGPPVERTAQGLSELLARIDGRGYKAYRDLTGVWQFSEFELHVDHVQGDPFAAPSKLRCRVPLSHTELPDALLSNRDRRLASACFLARRFRSAIRHESPRRSGTGKGGLIAIDAGGQEVLERSALVFGEERDGSAFVEARIELGLPAAGRRVLGREADSLLVDSLPRIVAEGLVDLDDDALDDLEFFVDCIENQQSVRRQLDALDLVAFVGDGAILPRRSGVSEEPMAASETVPFHSPDSFRVEIEVPHPDAGQPGRVWHGMGIPKGVVLLVGGGYHGKSTLLRAIEHGIAPHLPGDGRETVVSNAGLVKIRAEDGRAVTGVDIHGFIDRLPEPPGNAKPPDTRSFSTEDASGSTSQAANIMEALEAGAQGLLLDEDTSATNFMVRDERMQALVHPDDEPITPFVDRVRELYQELGVSTLLVMGGSGDYFEAADHVIELKAYRPHDVTDRARAIVAERPTQRRSERRSTLALGAPRVPDPQSFDASRGRKDVKLSSRDTETLGYGTTDIDLRAVEQLFDASQTRAIAGALHLASQRFMGPGRAMPEILDAIEALIDEEGLDRLDPFHRAEQHPGNLARPRRFEIAAAIGRMRSLRLLER